METTEKRFERIQKLNDEIDEIYQDLGDISHLHEDIFDDENSSSELLIETTINEIKNIERMKFELSRINGKIYKIYPTLDRWGELKEDIKRTTISQIWRYNRDIKNSLDELEELLPNVKIDKYFKNVNFLKEINNLLSFEELRTILKIV